MSMEDCFSEFRENVVGHNQFFNSFYGEKKIVYADWTASGRLYRPIEEKMINRFGPFVGNTHSEASETGSTMTRAYLHAREIIKKHVNANQNDVLITSGFGMTSVVNKMQRILGIKISEKFRDKLDLSDEMRPVVFVTHMEHHSNQTSWLETISDVVVVEPNANGLIDLNKLEKTVKKYKNRPMKIGAFTACSNITGIQTPYHKMAAIMHENNGICFIDFAASAPYVSINMHPESQMEKLDGIFFSPHKFLGGPGTSGVMVFDSSLYSNKIPDLPGGGTVNWTNPWGERSYIKDIEVREDGGTPGFLQTIKTALCIQLKNKMNEGNMLKRENELVKILFSEMDGVDKMHILAGEHRERLGIVSFYVEDVHYNLIVKIMNDRFGVQMRGGCSCAGTYGHYLLNIGHAESNKITQFIDHGNLAKKPGWVRLSIHPIMTNEEVYYITDSIKKTIRNINEWKDDYKYNPENNEFSPVRFKQGDQSISEWFGI